MSDQNQPPVNTPPPGYQQLPSGQQGYPQQPGPYPGSQPVGYPAPAYVVAYPPFQPKGFSITALVLGLVSIFLGISILVPLGAVVFGIIGLKKEPAGKGMSITGLVLGGLNVLGWAVFWIVMIGMWIAVIGAAATYGTTTS